MITNAKLRQRIKTNAKRGWCICRGLPCDDCPLAKLRNQFKHCQHLIDNDHDKTILFLQEGNAK